MHIRISLLIIFLPLVLTAQHRISGTVVDRKTGEPIELVSIGIAGQRIGTTTNAEGKFQLLIRNTSGSDTLIVSMIGYESVSFPIHSLVGEDIIKLISKDYSLEEVTVRARKLVADDVIKNVIANRSKNYDSRPFVLEAYYRDLRKVNGKYDHLIEVALNTYGKGIDAYHRSIEILDTRKIDLVPFSHEENLLNSTLRLDYIANAEGFIKLSDFKNNKYVFEDIRSEGDNTIFVISTGVLPARKYTFYIREDNYAVIRLEMEDAYEDRGKLYIAPLDKTHQFRLRNFKVTNLYALHKGKYYPDHLSVKWDYDRYNTTTKTVYENSSWLRELHVNNINVNSTAQPDPSKLMTKFGAAIDAQMTVYNADFWKNFNVVPLTSKVIADLERGGALDEQFIRNGNKARKKKALKCDKDLSLEEKITCLIQHYQDQYDIPGGQLTVSVNGKRLLSKAFGYADLANKVPVTTATPFRIASVSKSLTAVAALKLVEEGKLELNKSVQAYVPKFPEKQWSINSYNLLGNTSGIRHYTDDDDFFRTKQYATALEAVEIFSNDSLLFEPGTTFYYSSYGFNLLGAVIEAASGMHYTEFMKQAIFEPAQMKSTVGAGTQPTPNESKYYILKDMYRIEGDEDNVSYKLPSGGLVSTTEDLVMFGNALLEGKLIKPETLQKLLTPQTLKSGEGTGYSFGWYVDTDYKGNVMIHHSGTAPAYSSHVLVYPSEKIVIAYLANTGYDTYFDKDLADRIVEMIDGK